MAAMTIVSPAIKNNIPAPWAIAVSSAVSQTAGTGGVAVPPAPEARVLSRCFVCRLAASGLVRVQPGAPQ